MDQRDQVAASTLAVAECGLSLVSILQTYVDAYSGARSRLPRIVAATSSTATSLRQINRLLEQNRDATTPVFKEACLQDVDGLAAKCKKIYVAIVSLLRKATESHGSDEEITELSAEDFKELSLNISKLGVWRDDRWRWLQPRLQICQEELKQVKFDVIVRLLLGSVAQFQFQHPTRMQGSFENEQSLRVYAENASNRRSKYARHIARKRAKLKKRAAKTKSCASSVKDDSTSSRPASRASTATIAAPQSSRSSLDLKSDRAEPSPDKHLAISNSASVEPTEPADGKGVTPGGVQPPVDVIATETPDKTNEGAQNKGTHDSCITTEAESSQARSHLQHLIPSWVRRLFSSKSLREWENRDIEIYHLQVFTPPNNILKKVHTKLQIEDKEVKATLANIKSRRGLGHRQGLLDQYGSLDSATRLEVDHTLQVLMESSVRERTWLAIDVMKGPYHDPAAKNRNPSDPSEVSIILYFELGNELEPIRVRDSTGSELVIPYASCQTWEMTRNMLCQHNWPFPTRIDVQSGRFSMYATDGRIISPGMWKSAIKPGMSLEMKVLPPVGPPRAMRPPNIVSVGPPSPPLEIIDTAEVYREMKELLDLEGDPTHNETIKLNVRELLGLWTNAVDTHIEACEDTDTSDGWSSSSSDSSYASSSIAD